MQSPDDSVCRGLADNGLDISQTPANDAANNTCIHTVIHHHPPPPASRLLASSVSSSSSLSSMANPHYANVAEIMSISGGSKKYDSNQVCF